jgi:hypothetical protein
MAVRVPMEYDDELKCAIVRCVWCGKYYAVPMTQEQYRMIEDRTACIQNILPDHSPGERELFISGTCDKCWDDMFSFDEEE